MLKFFLAGIVLGILAAAGALHLIPAVDQVRETSIVSVTPNGKNAEDFHINIPTDRIMMGDSNQDASIPAEMTWPTNALFDGLSAELFKVRNTRDVVVGTAARIVTNSGAEEVVEWMIHLPARGSMFINLDRSTSDGTRRQGEMLSGSREFELLSGLVTEGWVANELTDEDGPTGRIELNAIYFSAEEPVL